MQRHLKPMYALLLMYLFIGSVYGQINVIPTSAGVVNQFTMEDLFRINLVNTSGAMLNGKLKASILTIDQQVVAEAYSQPLQLEIGKVLSGKQIAWQRALQYGRNRVSSQLQLSGQLSAGDYSVCYQFIPLQGGTPNSSYCFEKEIRPFSQFNLLSPYDEEVVSLPNPILSWQPLRAFTRLNGLQYSLKLVKLTDQNQAPERAIAMNPPLFELANLTSNSLPYPMTALPLVDGETYAWQVTAHQGENETGKTQIWQFTYQVPKKERPKPKDYSYTYASTTSAGHYTPTQEGSIHLAYDNHYGLASLDYDVKSTDGSNNKQFEHPEIKLQPGLNLISLPIEKITNSKEDVFLVIRIKEPNGSTYYLPIKHAKM